MSTREDHYIRSTAKDGPWVSNKGAWVSDDYYYAWEDMNQADKDRFAYNLAAGYQVAADAQFNGYVIDHFKGSVPALRAKWALSDRHTGSMKIVPLKPATPDRPNSGGGKDWTFYFMIAAASALGLFLLVSLYNYVR